MWLATSCNFRSYSFLHTTMSEETTTPATQDVPTPEATEPTAPATEVKEGEVAPAPEVPEADAK